MKALVVGYGSIGKRHVRILNELGILVGLVSRRILDYKPIFNSIEPAIKSFSPNIIVVANETSKHLETLNLIMEKNYEGIILIEKPLFQSSNITSFDNENIFVGYNLRFHPLLQKLKTEIKNQKIISCSVYVGQYLPTWRPSADYRKTYSASKMLGGGVLRDLSHELDYLQWIFGSWKRLISLGGKFSSLEIESEDSYSLLTETELCPLITIEMNYLDKICQRFMIVNTEDYTYKIDFINGTFQKNSEIQYVKVSRDETYRKQYLAIINKNFDQLCTFEEGLSVIKMVESIERSNEEKGWVYNAE
ncbi:oxidoreductase domain-containing protein [Bacillus methanolicus PB1]|uniref:Oxidoreductase domain-containing protein n=1 Tax=Bacillus methanolicus PB1 TaxID=997296 RepID=I3E213_BACMT|nr:Gfo/Idh/MocA family oxidoreductase [Bacillus methanolicus]EIJ80534.1 oxidoreductase domain-containing protein [Bacillus methanolicus PB1]